MKRHEELIATFLISLISVFILGFISNTVINTLPSYDSSWKLITTILKMLLPGIAGYQQIFLSFVYAALITIGIDQKWITS